MVSVLLPDLIAAQARRSGTRECIATIGVASAPAVSYHAFALHIVLARDQLEAAGLLAGERVGFIASGSVALYAFVFGAMAAGAAACMLHHSAPVPDVLLKACLNSRVDLLVAAVESLEVATELCTELRSIRAARLGLRIIGGADDSSPLPFLVEVDAARPPSASPAAPRTLPTGSISLDGVQTSDTCLVSPWPRFEPMSWRSSQLILFLHCAPFSVHHRLHWRKQGRAADARGARVADATEYAASAALPRGRAHAINLSAFPSVVQSILPRATGTTSWHLPRTTGRAPRCSRAGTAASFACCPRSTFSASAPGCCTRYLLAYAPLLELQNVLVVSQSLSHPRCSCERCRRASRRCSSPCHGS